jgi:hypothetical protein
MVNHMLHMKQIQEWQSLVNTLGWLAGDYLKQPKHHINQIISSSFDVIYN